MKYIRTKNGIYEVIEECFKPMENNIVFIPQEGLVKILKQSNTIEELCDCFIGKVSNEEYIHLIGLWERKNYPAIKEVYGAIWTDKGLIYVAKMNDKGDLELL